MINLFLHKRFILAFFYLFFMQNNLGSDTGDRILSVENAQFDLSKLAYIDFDQTFHDIASGQFVARYEWADKKLYFFGSLHSFDFRSISWQMVKAGFEAEVPDFLIVEDSKILSTFLPTDVEDFRTMALKIHNPNDQGWFSFLKSIFWKKQPLKGNEMTYAVNQSVQSGIDFITVEPSVAQVLTALESKGYPKIDIVAMFAGLAVNQVLRPAGKSVSLARWDTYIRYDVTNKLGVAYENIAVPYEYYERFIPAKSDGGEPSFSKIFKEFVFIRDLAIIERILQEALYGKAKKIMVLYGASHFKTQQEVLKQYLGEPVIMTWQEYLADKSL